MSDLDGLLTLAGDVARRAGSLLLARGGELTVATKSSPTDVVTEMDRAAERLIVDALRAARPDDGVLGEEGADDEGTSGVRWVVDPLDGTVNYLYGIPHWAISIAAEVDGELAVGAVFDPSKDELYAAARGRGASCNGRQLRVHGPQTLAQALVATGFGYRAARRRAQARVVAGLLPDVRDIRRLGTASLDLCAVASGRVDAYYERGMHRWDFAAGTVVAAEAGAVVAGLSGAPPSSELVIAAPPALFGQLHDRLAALDAARD